MLFNSLEFLLFFPLVTALYFLLPHRARWALLLGASCIFYMAFKPIYILILLFTILIDYAAGILIEDALGVRRQFYLSLSIVANVGVLAVFKYYHFVNANLALLCQSLGLPDPLPALNIILPIGLSFHTFQAMAYTIEIYRKNQRAERHFGLYALYVMFYPQLVAGPIERPQNLIHQFHERHNFCYPEVLDGLRQMLWGFFKKIVIADRLAVLVNQVYNHPAQYKGAALLLATYAFAFQIYCDFSGYSDIALGAAQVMGFRLMKNFDRPYHAQSISEFWSRWHISLSSWFRDYLYIPLGGNRVSRGRWYTNLLIVFLVSGLWHGANWTFLVWGALHGSYLVFALWSARGQERAAQWLGIARHPRLRTALNVLITFHLVTFAWIFFRANSLSDARYIITNLPSGLLTSGRSYAADLANCDLGLSRLELLVALLGLLVLEAVHLAQLNSAKPIRQLIAAAPFWVRWPIYYGIVAALFLFGKFDSQEFIYFQF